MNTSHHLNNAMFMKTHSSKFYILNLHSLCMNFGVDEILYVHYDRTDKNW